MATKSNRSFKRAWQVKKPIAKFQRDVVRDFSTTCLNLQFENCSTQTELQTYTMQSRKVADSKANDDKMRLLDDTPQDASSEDELPSHSFKAKQLKIIVQKSPIKQLKNSSIDISKNNDDLYYDQSGSRSQLTFRKLENACSSVPLQSLPQETNEVRKQDSETVNKDTDLNSEQISRENGKSSNRNFETGVAI